MVHWGCRRPPLYVGINAGPVGSRYPGLLISTSEGILKDVGRPHVPVVIVSRLDELRIVGDQDLQRVLQAILQRCQDKACR
jgi:hypothetical protein